MADFTQKDAIERMMAAAAAAAPAHDTPDGGKMVVIPAGYMVQRVAPLEPPLPRIAQSVTMHDAASFTAYVVRYKSAATQLFAEPGFLANGAAHVTAVLDYHEPNRPDRCAHVATYLPRYSEQWQRWHKAAQQPMKQAEFAEFIEEHRGDISKPSAATLLDMVRTFKASKKVDFDSVTYQANGDVMLTYDERTTQTGKSGPIPEQMELGIPVYFRGAMYAVPVFIRFRVGNGAVAFQIKLDRSDIIEDAAFTEVASKISESVGIAAYLGRR
jgi:uncharacterized protein YfdQ (DUF2303 family)